MLHQNEMRHISAIVTIAVLYKNFRPDQIGNRRDSYFIVEELCGSGILEPVVRYRSNQVGGSKNQIDIKLPFEDFGDPTFVQDLSLVPERCEFVENFWIIAGFDKDVDVLGRAP